LRRRPAPGDGVEDAAGESSGDGDTGLTGPRLCSLSTILKGEIDGEIEGDADGVKGEPGVGDEGLDPAPKSAASSGLTARYVGRVGAAAK
jgi:hypothetical protein